MIRFKQKQVDRFLAAIRGRPWLRLVETSATQIPERLNELDPNLFVVYNLVKQRFEVHDCSVPFRNLTYVLQADSLDMRVYYRVLDARVELNPIGRAEEAAKVERESHDRWLDDQTRQFAKDLADAIHLDIDTQRVFPAAKPVAG